MEQLYVKFTKSAQQKVTELTAMDYRSLSIYKEVQPVFISKVTGRNESGTYIYLGYVENENIALSFFIELLKDEAVCIAVQKFTRTNLQSTKLNIEANVKLVERKNSMLSNNLLQKIKQLKNTKEHLHVINTRMEQWQDFLTYDFEKAKRDIQSIDLKIKQQLEPGVFIAEISSSSKKNFTQWSIYEITSHHIRTYDEFKTTHRRRVGAIISKEKGRQYKINLSCKLSKQKDYYAINDGKLIQLERQLAAMRDLTLGRVANNEVENWIFGEAVNLTASAIDLPRTQLFNKDLNKWQYEAVKGALAANDLYCIQGPPGTGKTTVITEICFQNTKKGLKTLIASQSNLAVDNVLAKLMADSNMLMLRKGDPERVEEEGVPFIEQNVIYNWKNNIIQLSTENFKRLQQDIAAYEPKNFNVFNIEQQDLNEKIERQIQIISELGEREADFKNELVVQQELITNISHEYKAVINEAKKLGHYTQIEAVKKTIAQYSEKITALADSEQQLEKAIAQEQLVLANLQSIEGISKMYYQKKALYESLTNELSNMQAVHQQQEKYFAELKQEIEFAETLYTKYPTAIIGDLPYYVQKYTMSLDMNLFKEESNKLLEIDTELYEINKQISRYEAVEQEANQLFIQRQINVMQTNSANAVPINLEEAINRFMNHLRNQPKQLGSGLAQYIVTDEWFSALCQDYTYFRISGHQLYVALQQATKKREQFNEATNLWAMLTKFQQDLMEIMQQERATLSRMFSYAEKYKNLQQSIQNTKVAMEEISKGYNELKMIPNLNEYYRKISEQAEKIAHVNHKKDQLKQEQKELEQDVLNEQTALESFSNEKQQLREKLLQRVQFLESQSRLINRKKKQIIGEQRIVFYQKEQPTTEMYTLKEQLRQLQLNYTRELEHQQEQQVFIEEKAMLLDLQQEWIQEIKQLKGNKLEELASIYIEHANVIGTTCIQSGARKFKEAFKEFDVVIIDEVSKATPPEILLPVLKGKKVILVGDHKQLPPMIEEDLLNELFTAEEYSHTEKKDLKTYYKESLFEHLFGMLTAQFKMTLYTQYRMHPQMMNLIQQFYQDQQQALECGLTKPDEQRAHHLPLAVIQPTDHVVWLDVPNTPDFYEEFSNKSYRNVAELKLIKRTVSEMVKVIQQQKKSGQLAQDYKKDIGIISFYSGQVLAIQEMLEQLDQQLDVYRNANFRVGTVDRFQGIEKEVVIISFVRNNEAKQIGFAKDPRRVNVALSRAQQLLVIIGSKDNFGDKLTIYQNIIGQLQRDKRLINTMEMV